MRLNLIGVVDGGRPQILASRLATGTPKRPTTQIGSDWGIRAVTCGQWTGPALVLVRIERFRPGHRNPERLEAVKDADRPLVRCEDAV